MLVNNAIGFMQGRLTEKGGFFPQEFPEENWAQELCLAKDLGFDCIEWMFNESGRDCNPIFWEKELDNIIKICRDTNIEVSGICANYFMERSIYDRNALEDNLAVLNKLVCHARIIGCINLIIPLFGASEIQLDNTFIYDILDKLPENNVYILFESNEHLADLKKWISGFDRNRIGICYDIGNAVGLGYDSVKELSSYGDIVKNVHLKDKRVGGTTVMLGDGDADFKACFEALNRFSYSGCYILESYYNEAVRDTYRNLDYIKEIIK